MMMHILQMKEQGSGKQEAGGNHHKHHSLRMIVWDFNPLKPPAILLKPLLLSRLSDNTYEAEHTGRQTTHA